MPARPDRLDRPRATHFDRLGRSESLDEPLESPRVAPSRSTEAPRATKVDRKGRPRRPETQFSTISGRFSGRFSRFFDAACDRLHARLATLEIALFAHSGCDFRKTRFSQNDRKSIENRSECACRRNRATISQVFPLSEATWGRFCWPRGGSGPSWATFWLPGESPGRPRPPPGRAWDAPGAPRERSEMLPGRLRSALGAPRSIFGRFWVPRAPPGSDFWSIFGSILTHSRIVLARESQAISGRLLRQVDESQRPIDSPADSAADPTDSLTT